MQPSFQRAVFQGSVLAHALLLRDATIGVDARIDRVIGGWGPGCQVFALEPGVYLWMLPGAVRVTCDACLGLPLVLHEGALWGLPLSQAQRASLAAPAGSIVYAEQGALRATMLETSMRVDPSSWLALPPVVVSTTRPLIEPTPVVVEIHETKDVREVLKDVPGAAPERQQFMNSLKTRSQASSGRALARRGRLLDGVRRLVELLPRWWPSWRWGLLPQLTRGAGAPSRTALSQRRESMWRRLRDSVARQWRTRLLLSPLGRMFTRAQSAYLRNMLELFERSDLTEALRHAIPLGGDGGLTPPAPALGVPSAHGLQIQLHRAAATTSFQFGDELYEHLRQRYLKAAAQLREQGRWEEAAYVYAELLGDAHAAVELLQSAGRHRQAAELAEARKLAPAVIVRAWMLAKDVDRAIEVAVEHSAFADAIRLLEPREREAADALRLTWANRLASAGQYPAAVDALWPLSSARSLALHWMRTVIQHGGVPAARMLSRMLTLLPDAALEYRAAFDAIWQDDTDVGVMTRSTLGRQLVADKPLRAGAIASRCLREILNDEGNGHVSVDRRFREELGALADDPLLVADLPPPSAHAVPELLKRSDHLQVHWTLQDVGARAIHDAVVLPNGGWGLALGEAGLHLLDRRGRMRTQLNHPAHHLVATPEGSRLIALAPRDTLLNLTRIDAVARRAQAWGLAQFDAWARGFNGEHWFVRSGDTVQRLDATHDGLRATWRVSDPALEGALLFGANGLVAMSAQETWHFDRATKLRKRDALKLPHSLVHACAWDFAHMRPVAVISVIEDHDAADAADHDTALHLWTDKFDVPLADSDTGRGVSLTAELGWAATSWATDAGRVLVLSSLMDGRVLFRLQADGATRTQARFCGHVLLICDDLGRLLALDTVTGHVILDHRSG